MAIFIGLDIGTTQIKVVAINEKYEVLQQESILTPVDYDNYGRVHDAAHLVQSCQSIVRKVMQEQNKSQVKAVSIASVGEEGFFLDGSDKPLYPSIVWFEQRGGPSCDIWIREHPDAQSRTGLALKPSYSLFKWLWFKDTFPDVLKRATKWVSISDYIGFILSGVQCISFSQATRTYVFEPFSRSWISPWIDDVLPNGIDSLPSLAATGSVIGYTTSSTGDEWGIPSGVAIVVGGHDHPIGAIGGGVKNSTKILDSMGTAELMYWPVRNLKKPALGSYFMEQGYTGYPEGPYYLAAGTYTGMIIKTLCRLFGIDFETVYHMEFQKPLKSSELQVIPNALGGKPSFSILSLTDDISTHEIVVAAFEASAMVIKIVMEAMCGATPDYPQIIAIGGGSSKAALQIKANVVQQPIYSTHGIEVVAFGAAKVAREAIVKDGGEALAYDATYPDPSFKEYYEEKITQFKANWLIVRKDGRR